MYSARYSCQILIQPVLSWQIFEKLWTFKYYENPSGVSWFVPCGQTDVTNIVVTFHNFANAPKKIWKCNLLTNLLPYEIYLHHAHIYETTPCCNTINKYWFSRWLKCCLLGQPFLPPLCIFSLLPCLRFLLKGSPFCPCQRPADMHTLRTSASAVWLQPLDQHAQDAGASS